MSMTLIEYMIQLKKLVMKKQKNMKKQTVIF